MSKIKWIKQPNKFTCGQTCIAMAMGVSVRQVIKLIGHNGPTHNVSKFKVIRKLGGNTGKTKAVSSFRVAPELALVTTGYRKKDKRTKTGYSYTRTDAGAGFHCVLWADGKFYDPWYGVSKALKAGQYPIFMTEIFPGKKRK